MKSKSSLRKWPSGAEVVFKHRVASLTHCLRINLCWRELKLRKKFTASCNVITGLS